MKLFTVRVFHCRRGKRISYAIGMEHGLVVWAGPEMSWARGMTLSELSRPALDISPFRIGDEGDGG